MASEITIVDNNDNVIGLKKRQLADVSDIYRVSCLWVENSGGDILLARRALTKAHDPGKWGPAVAGTVEYDDSYEDTIRREAFEELGVSGVEFQKVIKEFTKTDFSHFTQYFRTILDYQLDKFSVQIEEVAEIKWFPRLELEELLNNNPEIFIQSMPRVFELYSDQSI